MSYSAGRSAAMFRAIRSCFSVSCSTPRRTTARSRGIASSCCTNSGAVAATAGNGAGGYFVDDIEDNEPSDGVQFLKIFLAPSLCDSQADEPPTPIRAPMKQAATARSARLAMDELPLAT